MDKIVSKPYKVDKKKSIELDLPENCITTRAEVDTFYYFGEYSKRINAFEYIKNVKESKGIAYKPLIGAWKHGSINMPPVKPKKG